MSRAQFSQLGGGQRMSRLEGWRSQQQQLLDKPVHSTAAACGPVTHFGSHSSPQILLFVREDGTLALGYCLSVYRGAPISGTAARTLKVSRPSARPIPAGLMLEFVQSLQRTCIGTLLNPVHMIDPTSACGQTKASNVQQNADRLTVTFSTPSTCRCTSMLGLGRRKLSRRPRHRRWLRGGLDREESTPVARARWIPIYMASLHPSKDGALERLKHFAPQVNLHRAPWLPVF